MNYVVYILQSETTGKYYVGQTQDLFRRIKEHNNSESTSTKNGVPWKLVHLEEFGTRSEAVRREQQIKNRGVKRYLRDLETVAQSG
ncbi:MAG: GIY-YIG nuclease family protein [Ignavibacteriae bacterium]|nr:GIY-YIG nuclease family protein [Ignavibacteriota bacterium]